MSEYRKEALALGTDFRINLAALSKKEAPYTVDQFITALEATTTLTELRVDLGFGSPFEPTAEHNRLIFAPLCRSIADLHHRNEHHPLKTLELGHAWRAKNSSANGIFLDVFEQFLVAAKRFGIRNLTLYDLSSPMPIQFLLKFSRENSRLRVLEIKSVNVSDSTDVVSCWPPHIRPQESFVSLHLDKLSLDGVYFRSSTAAASFGA